MRLSEKSIWILVLIIIIAATSSAFAQDTMSDVVYVLPIKGIVDNGMAKFVDRGVLEANRVGAKAIIFEIDTPGGQVQAASLISESILGATVPTISFVNPEAMSAGVIVVISADDIAMAPASTIGAAETRPKEEKYISAWSKKLQTVAELKGRDKKLVAAMADADVVIEGLKEKDKILTLTGAEAVELGLADANIEDISEVLEWKGLDTYEIVNFTPNTAERIAFLATNPYTAPLILTIGVVGAVVEILTPGFGFAGGASVIAFSLFFGGSFLAGAAKSWVMGLFILGLFLLAIEMFIPGFGVFGMTGIVSIVGSIIIAFPSLEQATMTLSISLVASIVILYFLTKLLIKTPVFGKIVLGESQEREKGYIATSESHDLVGKQGITVTTLRPAGSVQIGQEKFDVITNGDFIPKGIPVEVLSVEGRKIIVDRKEP